MVVGPRDQGRGYPAAMVHLRIVLPSDLAPKVLDLLDATPSACNLVYLPGTARRPPGDVILCDIAREDASIVIADCSTATGSRSVNATVASGKVASSGPSCSRCCGVLSTHRRGPRR